MRPGVDDTLRDLAAEAQAGPIPGLNEAPHDVFLALVEDYRQAAQDAVYGDYGDSWPSLRAQEAEALERLHDRCDAWVARYEGALERAARGGQGRG
jgi:hypothetical protein